VQGDIAECFLSILVPGLMVISGMCIVIDQPLSLCPEVGLHCSMPMFPVGTSEERDHLVQSTGHGGFLLGVNGVSK